MDFIEIDEMRRKHKISVAQLCAVSGVGLRSYQRIKAGERTPRADTLARLAQGVSAVRKGGKQSLPTMILYRLVTIQFCMVADLDPGTVLAQDASKKATADKDWLEASRIRAMAIYVLNTVVGIPNAEIARTLSITPAAVTMALGRVEEKRSDPKFEELLGLFEKAVSYA